MIKSKYTLFYIIVIGKIFLLSFFSTTSGTIYYLKIDDTAFIDLLLKFVLLLSDISVFYLLLIFYKHAYFKIIFFYFLNPIIIYTTYYYLKLDLVYIAMLMYAFYFIDKKHIISSGLLLGIALAMKIELILLSFITIIYVSKKYSFKKLITFIAIASGIFFIMNSNYILNHHFLDTLMMNIHDSELLNSRLHLGNLEIFPSLLITFIISFHMFAQKKVNLELFFYYNAILITLILLFTSASAQNYTILVPFMVIYYINSNFKKSLAVHIAFSILYILFNMSTHMYNYKDITNIIFTMFESFLIILIVIYYKYGILTNINKKSTNMMIGIGGDSGTGKTSLLNNIGLLLGSKLLSLEGDGEHKWERGNLNWKKFTHLSPKANNIYNQVNAIMGLKNNRYILRSDYDHETGKFTEPLKIMPNEFISLSGLHPFYLPLMRKNIDLKIYIDTQENLRRHWKIVRDIKKRGYSFEQIMQQIEDREEDAKKYIYPQKKFSDLVIRYSALNEFILGDADAKTNLSLEIRLDANIQLENIIKAINCQFEWDYNEDLETQYIKFFTEPDVDFELLAQKNLSYINDILDVKYQWFNGYRGTVQFFVILALNEKMKG